MTTKKAGGISSGFFYMSQNSLINFPNPADSGHLVPPKKIPLQKPF